MPRRPEDHPGTGDGTLADPIGPKGGQLRPSRQPRDQRDDEEDDEHPEQQTGGFHSEAGDAAEADRRSDQGDDEEHQRIVKQVTNDEAPWLLAPRRGGPLSQFSRGTPRMGLRFQSSPRS